MSTDDDGLRIEQRTVDASAAPRIQTTGVSSAFALGAAAAARLKPTDAGQTPPHPVPRKRRLIGMAARAVQTLDACGLLSVPKLAEAMEVTEQQARDVCSNGVARGYITRPGTRDDSGHLLYGCAPGATELLSPRNGKPVQKSGAMKGFKGWLDKRGQQAASGSKAVTAPSAAPVAPAATAAQSPELICGLFNDGSLRIELADRHMVLTRPQARELVAYLDRIAGALGTEVRP